VFLLLTVCGLAIAPGCTKEEKLFRVSGTITHNGKPVPKGVIHFDPKSEGTSGFASIADGKYDTLVDKSGVRAGAYEIRINGFDGKPVGEAPFGQAVFPEYTGTKEFPPEDSVFDVEVPKGR
jgi:hypothetical protein